MPLIRIDLRKGKDQAYRQKISKVVHDSLVGVGVPADDRFQIVAEHGEDGLVYDAHYLGVDRTDDIVIVQVTWNEGRTTDQKKALYKAIADGLHEAVGLRKEDVFINLVEVKRENWSFGNGIAQYAT